MVNDRVYTYYFTFACMKQLCPQEGWNTFGTQPLSSNMEHLTEKEIDYI